MSSPLLVAASVGMGPEQVAIDFVGSSNIWIDETYDSRPIELGQQLVLRALQDTAPGQLEIVVFDYLLRGFAAPFANLQTASDRMLTILGSPKDLLDYCATLRMHVEGVKNVIQGREPSLLEFRATIGSPVESYKLVVLVVDFFFLDEALKEQLSILMRSGPTAGVTFLVIAPNDESAGQILNKGEELCFEPGVVVTSRGRFRLERLPAGHIIAECDRITHLVDTSKSPPIRFNEIQDVNHQWGADSSGGLTFAVGMYGVNVAEITLGNEKDQRHNALVTGAVGQGKSNLLSVIIHSLCQRYSPDQLELYLLDFKEGVTLEPFSNRRHEDYLPQARVLGLESDTDFGIAVLEHLHDVYEQRMRLFKGAGTQNLQQYRRAHAGERLPRILLIIDEFQMMFSDRDTSREVAALLSRSVRLFRAAGIHVVLASQTISTGVDLPKDSDVFAQIPIRIALKNSVRESEATLTLGNSAAADLRMGQAIVNLNYGAIAANRKVSIALADDAELKQLRHGWWLQARTTTSPPFTFDGNHTAQLVSVLPNLLALRNSPDDVRRIFLGEEISVETSARGLVIDRTPGRNLAILGLGDKNADPQGARGPTNAAIGMLQSAGLALAFQHPSGDARFVCFDLLSPSVARENNLGAFMDKMAQLGFAIERYGESQVEAVLNDLAGELPNRGETDEATYLLGFALDRLPKMPKPFEQIIKEGPSRGIHTLGWWQKVANFNAHIGFGNASTFDIKAILRVDEREVSQLLGPFVQWQVHDNRALVADSTYLNTPEPIIPFMPLTPEVALQLHL